jgi:hypothetical protein
VLHDDIAEIAVGHAHIRGLAKGELIGSVVK